MRGEWTDLTQKKASYIRFNRQGIVMVSYFDFLQTL